MRRLQRSFGYYVDQGSWDEAADLFTADASIEIALDGVYEGRESIRRYLYALGGGRRGLAYGDLRECLQLQPVVHVAPDAATAKARWRALILSGRCGERASWSEGPYENEYRREEGIWKISRLHWYQTFDVPYDGGWAANADVTGGKHVSGALRPDAEPTEIYEVWPGVHTPPFHFATVGAWNDPGQHSSTSDPALAALEHRTRLLEDAAAIESLIGAYGYYLDKQLWDRVTELFAEDGSMEVSLRGVYVGKRSIRRALELFGPHGIQPGSLHNHFQLQPVIHVAADGCRAWARSRAFSQLGTYQGAALWHGGIYECEFIKIEGVWKYKRDHIYTTYFADYTRGWAFGARTAPKPSDTVPPDSPPTEHYEVFPARYVPPFHYRHPVTGAEIATTGCALTQDAALAALPADTLLPELPAAAGRAAVELTAAARTLCRLEDEQAIEILQRTYGFFIDKALYREAADLFCDDGTLEIGGTGAFAGKRSILDHLIRVCPGGFGHLFDVMQLQPVITISEDGATARGRWRCFAQVARQGEWAAWRLDICENEYVKEKGVWKIRRLEAHPRLSASYAHGWLRAAPARSAPLTASIPDLPPGFPARPYPDTFIPPCRFPHPVSAEGSETSVRAPQPPQRSRES